MTRRRPATALLNLSLHHGQKTQRVQRCQGYKPTAPVQAAGPLDDATGDDTRDRALRWSNNRRLRVMVFLENDRSPKQTDTWFHESDFRGGRLRRDSVSVPLSGSSAGWVHPVPLLGPDAGRALARPE